MPPEQAGPVSARALLADPDGLVEGTNVHFEDVLIRAKSGNMLRIRIGDRDMFVAPIDPSELEYLRVGARVDIRGSLRETPSATQAQLLFAMDRREAARLARDRVYVDAWVVSAIN